jgi:hypothetical protein
VSMFIESHARLAARFPAQGDAHLGESLISSENGDPPDAGSPPEWVRVYSLHGLRLPVSNRRAEQCAPNKAI